MLKIIFFPGPTNLCRDQRLPFNKKDYNHWILLLGFLHPINKALFGLFFLVTQFLSFINPHSSLKNTMFVWHHHSLPITQYFSHYLWTPYLSPGAAFFFFSSLPKLTEPSEKKKIHPEHEDWTSERRRKKKKKKRRRNPEETKTVKEEEEKKKKEPNSQPRRRKEKKS